MTAYVLAYLLACFGGWLVVAACLYLMRRATLKEPEPFIDVPAIFGGVTERAVALTLALWAPPYLPSFIGGWVLLKFAIGWQRKDYDEEVATGSFLALIGIQRRR